MECWKLQYSFTPTLRLGSRYFLAWENIAHGNRSSELGYFTSSLSCVQESLINTLLQRGAKRRRGTGNRFNGLPHFAETVKTVFDHTPPPITPLKRGVNEKRLQMRHPFVKYWG